MLVSLLTNSTQLLIHHLPSWNIYCHSWRITLQERFLVWLALSPSRPVSIQSFLRSPVNPNSIIVYNDLAHPPATYIGPEYQFRAADGSSNNPDAPNLGKAGTPYARSVQGANPLPRNQMPDAGLVFDTLLRREKVRISHYISLNPP